MNRGSEYKNSVVDWIGEIPIHWDLIQPKYILNRVTRPIEDDDETITCFRDGQVTLRKNRREDGFTNSTKEHGYQQIRPRDLVIHEMDGFAGAIGISDSKGKSTPVYTVIEPDGKTDLRFVAYLLREMSRSGKIQSLARSIRERTTDFRWKMWSNISFCFPPLQEQTLISSYLDRKTSQIDSLIEKIERKTELLKEQRTSLINQCVTKGLNPDVEMKDSGVEWIGKIPHHWEVSFLKYVSSYMNKKRLPKQGEKKISPEYVESGTGRIMNYYSDYGTEGVEFLFGDTLLNKLRVYLSKVVFCNFPGLSMGEMIVLRPTKYNPKYQFHLISSSLFIDSLNSLSEGVKVPRPPIEGIMKTAVPVPPQNEQILISKYLDKKTSQIDSLIGQETKRIELLKEYRQSLISNIVTGKVRITEEMI